MGIEQQKDLGKALGSRNTHTGTVSGMSDFPPGETMTSFLQILKIRNKGGADCVNYSATKRKSLACTPRPYLKCFPLLQFDTSHWTIFFSLQKQLDNTIHQNEKWKRDKLQEIGIQICQLISCYRQLEGEHVLPAKMSPRQK